jgi:hypothetical protein
MNTRFAYFCSLLASAFWFYATGIYGEQPAGYGLTALALAFACASWAPAPAVDLSVAGWLLLLGAGAGGVLAFSPPYQTGGMLLLGAGLLGLVPCGHRMVMRARTAGLHLGLLLSLQAALWLLGENFFAKWHEAGFVAPLAAGLMRAFGEDAVATGGRVSVVTHLGPLAVLPTYEGLQVVFFALFLAGALYGLVVQGAARPRAVVLVMAVVAGYCVLRYAAVVLLAVQAQVWTPLCSPHVLLLSALPLPFLLPHRLGTLPACMPGVPPAVGPRLASAAFLAACLAAYLGLAQPGPDKPGRVLINEHNSDWEKTTQPYDKRWFGSLSGYNYYLMAKFLGYHYHVPVNQAPLTDRTLERVDVLILKTPTAPYGEEEVAAIERFVRRGGGVLLIGDHTNVFGMTEYLNQVAGRFGLWFNFDSQHSIVDGGLTLYQPPRHFRHPVVAGLPPFLWYTSCTLRPPLFSEEMVVGYGNLTAPTDYEVSNFFSRERVVQLDRRFGYVSQISGVCAGRGRVLAFTDSTVFSNFSTFVPGKPELLLGMMAWVNKTNGFIPVKATAFCLGLLGLVAVAWTGRRGGEVVLGGLSFCAAFAFATLAVDGLNRRNYAPVAPHSKVPEVVFCREGTDYFLPRTALTPPRARQPGASSSGQSYNTFYLLPARLGLIPREFDTVSACVARRPELIVLLNPVRDYPPAAREQLERYVRSGGKLLLITRNAAPGAARALLAAYGLGVTDEAVQAAHVRALHPGSRGELVLAHEATFRPLRGGTPLLGAGDDAVCCTYQPAGEGFVACLSLGDLLHDDPREGLGPTSQVPNEKQLPLYLINYWLFRGLYGLREGGRLPGLPSLQEEFGPGFLERGELNALLRR